jgi:hypothetical protein
LKEGQLVWTLNLAEAVAPLVCPVAWMVWAPGCADFGTSMDAVKLPELSAVALPADAASKAKVTVSEGEKPEPVAPTLLPGEPMAGEIANDAAAARLERLAIRKMGKIEERMCADMMSPAAETGCRSSLYSKILGGYCPRIVKIVERAKQLHATDAGGSTRIIQGSYLNITFQAFVSPRL